MDIFIIYTIGIVGWLWFWLYFIGFHELVKLKSLWIPFLLCLVYLSVNLVISGSNDHVSNIDLEESLFYFIDGRSSLAVNATASVLIVATIIYSVTEKSLPKLFIIFIACSFICLVGLMAPIIWIPTDSPELLFRLRHGQTVPFLWGVFLSVSGIMVILEDILERSPMINEFIRIRHNKGG